MLQKLNAEALSFSFSHKEFSAIRQGVRKGLEMYKERVRYLEELDETLSSIEQTTTKGLELFSYPDFIAFVASAHEPLAKVLAAAELCTYSHDRVKLRASGHGTSYLSLHKGILKDLLERFSGTEVKKIVIEQGK
jgi:hypothetical protein